MDNTVHVLVWDMTQLTSDLEPVSRKIEDWRGFSMGVSYKYAIWNFSHEVYCNKMVLHKLLASPPLKKC